jgi:integrase
MYKQVLAIDLPWLDEVIQAKRPRRLPVVLTPSEVRQLLLHMDGTTGLIAQLLYGTGMRLMEALRLRVKDVEFERREIVIREGKGNKDRMTVLPENLIAPLKDQLQKARALHEKDLALGLGCVYCRMRWRSNIRRRISNGRGNGFFRRPCAPLIPGRMRAPARISSAATMFTRIGAARRA